MPLYVLVAARVLLQVGAEGAVREAHGHMLDRQLVKPWTA
jgi:hypothetical protein